MDGQSQAESKIRFGVFELDLASGELRKSGIKVRLQEQPFQVLKALLERPGEVVSREELQQRLWPDETFVDFEDGLSTAVRKIRQALGDLASSPRFVETLPKRGYRFVAPIDGNAGKGERPTRSFPLVLRYGLAACALAAVGFVLIRWNDSSKPPPTEPIRLPIPLTSYPGREETPDFSPDGSQVVFSWTGGDGGDLDIYAKAVGHGEPVQLTSDPGEDFAPVWSPDGRWIAFSRNTRPERRADLIVIPALGGRERKILDYGLNTDLLWRHAAWTPDSRWLILTVDGSSWDDYGGLSLVSIETGDRRPLTAPNKSPGRSLRDLYPAVSPDGRWVVFCRFSAGSGSIYKIRLTPEPGPQGSVVQVLPGSGALTLSPTWSPDGTEIIYFRTWGGVADGLWRVSAAGGQASRPLSLEGMHPVVSATAKRLVYQTWRGNSNIWRIPLVAPGRAAGEPERLLDSTRNESWPTYSPDESKIAFRSDRGGTNEIWVANADGSAAAPLTTMGTGATGNPRWSPDGRRLVFNSMASGNREVHLIDVEGGPGTVTNVTNHPANEKLPSWSADGSSVYFTSNRSGRDEVWKASPEGGKAVQVTTAGGSGAYESSDGRWLYFVREDRLWRMPVSGGSESAVLEGVSTHNWTLSEGGFYYVPIERGSEIRYFDFATGKHARVAELPANVGRPWVSAAGGWLTFNMAEESGSDLELVENFE